MYDTTVVLSVATRMTWSQHHVLKLHQGRKEFRIAVSCLPIHQLLHLQTTAESAERGAEICHKEHCLWRD